MLSQNAKWNEHLENMITNITKHLGGEHTNHYNTDHDLPQSR